MAVVPGSLLGQVEQNPAQRDRLGPPVQVALRWTYSFWPAADGTLVTESWEVLRIVPRMGETDDQLLALRDRTQANLEATLQALKDVAEAAAARSFGPGSPARS